jgi:glutamate 5-kinase
LNIDYETLRKKAEEIEASKDNNILIVSGAITLGILHENEKRDKSKIQNEELSGYASVGQPILVDIYKKIFKKSVGQVLVTEHHLEDSRSLIRVLEENLIKNRISLINYNDCVDFNQIRKDNDTLAAQILLAAKGDRLIILGRDYDGFMDSDKNLIERVNFIDETLYAKCNGKSKYGNGGFSSKLDAAKMLLDNKKELIISNLNYSIEDIIAGRVRRTLFRADY